MLVAIAPLLGAAIPAFWVTVAAMDCPEVGKHSILQGGWNFFFPAAAMVLCIMAATVNLISWHRPRRTASQRLPGASSRRSCGGWWTWCLESTSAASVRVVYAALRR